MSMKRASIQRKNEHVEQLQDLNKVFGFLIVVERSRFYFGNREERLQSQVTKDRARHKH